MSGERRRGSALRAWVGSFGTNVALLGVGIVTGIISARVLGPEGRGALAEVLFWGAFVAQIANLGLPNAVTIEAARTGRHERLIVTAAVLAVAYALLAGAVFGAISSIVVNSPLVALILAYTLVYLPTNILGLALSAVDRGRQRFGMFNALRLIPQLTYLVGILIILAFGATDVASFVWASFLGSLLVAGVRAVSLRQAFAWRPSVTLGKRLVVVGSQLHLQPMVGVFQKSGDRLLILAFLDQTALGFYAVALTFAGAGLQKVSGATTTILLPKAVGAGDDAERGRHLTMALSATLVTALALNGALALLCPVLIPALFGEAFAPAVPAAILLCLVQVVSSVVSILAVGLRSYNDWTAGPLASLASFVVFFAVASLSMPAFGIAGVALGLLSGNLVGAVLILGRAMNRTGLPLADFLVPPRCFFSPSEIRARLAKKR